MFELISCMLFGICQAAPPLLESKALTSVIFYENGASQGGLPRDFPDSKITSSEAIESLTGTDIYRAGASLYDGTGVRLENLLSVSSNDRLYVVPENIVFHWPFVEIGHKVRVPGLHAKEDVWIESVAEVPKIFYLHNFMNKDEPDRLRERALRATGANKMEKSTTGVKLRENRDLNDPSSFSDTRTSDNAWDMSSPDAKPIIDRSFDVARLPNKRMFQDGLQLVRYQVRQAYNSHHDYFPPRRNDNGFNFDAKWGGSNRLLTIFLYISDVEMGGQTVFPQVPALSDENLGKLSPELRELLMSHKMPYENVTEIVNDLFPKGTWQPGMVRDCYTKLSIRPRKGAALMFYSMKPDLGMEPRSMHGGCPVLKGTKWGANMWLWNNMRFGHWPDSDHKLSIKFTNRMAVAGQLVKRGSVLEVLEPGQSHDVVAFHKDQFTFRVNGKVVHTHDMDANLGTLQEQHFFAPSHSEL